MSFLSQPLTTVVDHISFAEQEPVPIAQEMKFPLRGQLTPKQVRLLVCLVYLLERSNKLAIQGMNTSLDLSHEILQRKPAVMQMVRTKADTCRFWIGGHDVAFAGHASAADASKRGWPMDDCHVAWSRKNCNNDHNDSSPKEHPWRSIETIGILAH
ncbi:hypothetical protein Scep_028629 [Stephania cephalantha]|uniref:Uncharacterized protein n=1 Tax=Stephania cephalantha TaxID=152367 RepID=A0AAP0HLZ8_9MAGN